MLRSLQVSRLVLFLLLLLLLLLRSIVCFDRSQITSRWPSSLLLLLLLRSIVCFDRAQITSRWPSSLLLLLLLLRSIVCFSRAQISKGAVEIKAHRSSSSASSTSALDAALGLHPVKASRPLI